MGVENCLNCESKFAEFGSLQGLSVPKLPRQLSWGPLKFIGCPSNSRMCVPVIIRVDERGLLSWICPVLCCCSSELLWSWQGVWFTLMLENFRTSLLIRSFWVVARTTRMTCEDAQRFTSAFVGFTRDCELKEWSQRLFIFQAIFIYTQSLPTSPKDWT